MNKENKRIFYIAKLKATFKKLKAAELGVNTEALIKEVMADAVVNRRTALEYIDIAQEITPFSAQITL